MAIRDYSDGASGPVAGVNPQAIAKLETRVDFAEENFNANDIAKLFFVKAGTVVLDVNYEVEEAVVNSGETVTADIGDYLDSDDSAVTVDGYADAINVEATGRGGSRLSSEAYAAGKRYDVDAWIGLKVLGGAAASGVIKATMLAIDAE